MLRWMPRSTGISLTRRQLRTRLGAGAEWREAGATLVTDTEFRGVAGYTQLVCEQMFVYTEDGDGDVQAS